MQTHSLSRLAVGLALFCLQVAAFAHEPLLIKPLDENKVTELPAGDLVWTIETFDSVASAGAAAGPWSLTVESAGKFWLFSLGNSGRPSSSGA
jgi:hypothetical protein